MVSKRVDKAQKRVYNKGMIKEMIKLQKATGYTDGQFADAIGITREWWNALKNGKGELTIRVKQKAVKAFPVLRKAFLEELKI